MIKNLQYVLYLPILNLLFKPKLDIIAAIVRFGKKRSFSMMMEIDMTLLFGFKL